MRCVCSGVSLLLATQTLWCRSLSRRIEAETTVPVSSVLVEGLPPHASDVGPEGEAIPPVDELWNIKRRLDLVSLIPFPRNALVDTLMIMVIGGSTSRRI